jgi:hypothetical protein
VHQDIGARSKWLLFLCASSVAYPLAQLAGIAAGGGFGNGASVSGNNGVSPLALFVGGGVGAGIVLMSGLVLFGGAVSVGRTLSLTLLGAVGGGALAVLGMELDGIYRAMFANRVVVVFMLWQPGVALMLGLLLGWSRRCIEAASAVERGQLRESAGTGRRFLAGGLFLCVFVALCFYVFRGIQSYWDDHRIDSMYATLQKEQPSRVPTSRRKWVL